MRPQRLSLAAPAPALDARTPSTTVPRMPALALVPATPGPVACYDGGPGAARGRRQVMLTMIGLHVLVVAGLLAATRGHQVVTEAAPLILSLVNSPEAAPAPKPLPPPPQHVLPVLPRLDVPLIAPEPSPSPSPLLAQATPPTPPAPVAVEARPAPPAPPAPAPAARTLPAAGLQFLVPPTPAYSTMSRRMGETGKVVVRVYVDEQGLPRDVQVSQSSGFARLDDSAVSAVRKTRFKPWVENGVAVAGFAFIPIEFGLDK